MDKKRMLVGMVLVMALVLGWELLVSYLRQSHPEWFQQPAPQQQAAATTQPGAATGPAATQVAATTGPATSLAGQVEATTRSTAVMSGPALRVEGTAESTSLVELGSPQKKDATYAMGVTLTSRGAAFQRVVLNDFPMKIGSDERYVFQQPYTRDGKDIWHALAARSVTINGVTLDLGTANWRVENKTSDTATFAVDVVGSNGPVATVRKTFRVPQRSDPSQGFEPQVDYSIVNLGDQPLTVRTSFNGPALPPRELEQGADRLVMGGYNDSGLVLLERHAVEEFTADKPTRDLVKNSKGELPVIWAGTGSVYFNAIALPLPLQGGTLNAQYLSRVQAEALDVTVAPEQRDMTLTFETSDLTVAAGKGSELTLPLRVFLGPKERRLLNGAYYDQPPRGYDETLTISGGCCGFLTFGWLINLLVSLLNAFYWLFGGFAGHGDWGLAIIGLVVLVRLVLHPITKASTISMQKMGKFGPEVERLKKKYGDNKEELNKAMMQFYKEQGVMPFLGCLPLFLQMPIWIALWQALQSTFELRQAPFLWGFTWIHDLAKPDELIKFDNPIPLLLFGWHLYAINLLPILMAGVTWLQMRYQPKPVATTKEQEQQQKMMQWMSLLIPLMFYSMPSGLNLYYVTSMGLGIIESKRIRDHLKQKEEAEKAGKVLVDAKPTRAGRRIKEEADQRKQGGGLMGWLGQLQAKAEELRDEAAKKRK